MSNVKSKGTLRFRFILVCLNMAPNKFKKILIYIYIYIIIYIYTYIYIYILFKKILSIVTENTFCIV